MTGSDLAPKYARVVVNLDAPLENAFHYHLPPDLRDVVQPGHLVEVEFGTRIIQGVVVGLDDQSPVPETKPVIALVMPDPVLSPVHLALADWLGRTYLAPPIDCIRLMLPPGISQQADVTLELIPEAVRDQKFTESQQALVDLLAEKGDLRGRQISQEIPKPEWGPAAEQLVRRGILRRGSVLLPPRVRPKQVRTAQLVAGSKEIVRTLPTLGHRSVPAAVLEWLANNPDPLPPLDELKAATRCTNKHLDDLESRGAVTRQPGRTLVALSRTGHPPADLDPAEKEIVSFLSQSRTPATLKPGNSDANVFIFQSAAMPSAAALDPAHPDENSLIPKFAVVSRSALASLLQKKIVYQIDEPAVVSLAIPPRQVREAAAEYRGAGVYLKILNFLALEPEPVDVSWIYAATDCSLSHLKKLADADLIALGEREVWRDPLAGIDFTPSEAPALSEDQTRVWERVRGQMADPQTPATFLLHGVTGSGKTEIYLRAIGYALERNQSAIVLVPEIALTPQTIKRFSARFPGRVAVLHSRLSDGERYDTWRRARQGMVDIVIGPRSALFLPLSNLGVIVIDEEHDEAYKQDPPVRPPYYHAREVAIELARLAGAALIMGSATPDLVTYHRSRRGEFQLLELPLRIMGHRQRVHALMDRFQLAEKYRQDTQIRREGYHPLAADGSLPDALTIALPPVELVDMRQELRAGNTSIFSRALARALGETLEKGEQAILFLNRRGTSSFVFCRDCGLVLSCPRCELPLTFHKPGARLVCHHCGRTEIQPERCPRCHGSRIKYFGLGTEGVESKVLELFPSARVLRWDRDTTGGHETHTIFLQKFIDGYADVLVGTQMIAKGLDLPLVTLVGVISADVSLGLPDFRTGERTFQVLTQVAGRAGRGLLGGKVLFQTFNPDHYAIRAAADHDYAGFYVEEMEFRARMGYPPYKRLARLEYRDPSRERGRQKSRTLAEHLQAQAAERQLSATEILGPTQPFFDRLDGRYRWQIVIRAPDPTLLLQDLPLSPEWLVDIDPMSLL